MAVDMFLKLDGIEGESVDGKHRGEIQIQSFSWGLSQSGAQAGGGGGGTGKVSLQDFHFVATTGIQSPPLLVATATGKHFQKVMFTVRKAGERQLEYLKILLDGVLVSSYQLGATGGDSVPTDQFSLNFTKIQMMVTQQSLSGAGPGKVVSGGYDQNADNTG